MFLVCSKNNVPARNWPRMPNWNINLQQNTFRNELFHNSKCTRWQSFTSEPTIRKKLSTTACQSNEKYITVLLESTSKILRDQYAAELWNNTTILIHQGRKINHSNRHKETTNMKSPFPTAPSLHLSASIHSLTLCSGYNYFQIKIKNCKYFQKN